jgi:hypothetical protein
MKVSMIAKNDPLTYQNVQISHNILSISRGRVVTFYYSGMLYQGYILGVNNQEGFCVVTVNEGARPFIFLVPTDDLYTITGEMIVD